MNIYVICTVNVRNKVYSRTTVFFYFSHLKQVRYAAGHNKQGEIDKNVPTEFVSVKAKYDFIPTKERRRRGKDPNARLLWMLLQCLCSGVVFAFSDGGQGLLWGCC